MRINFLLGPFLPALPGPAGAVEKKWQGVAHVLARQGHQVAVLERATVVRHSSGVTYLGIPGFDRPRSLPAAIMLDMIYTLRALSRLPVADITLSNTFCLPLAPIDWLRKRLRPKSGILVQNVARAPKGQLSLYSATTHIVVPSADTKHRVLAALPGRISPEAVSVINDSIDAAVFKPDPARLRASPLRMLYAGRISREKGVHVLVAAFSAAWRRRAIANVELIVAGPHEIAKGGDGGDYLALCQSIAAGAPVEFRPAIHEPAALAALMQSAYFFCYPSLADKGETFGVSVVEAMACGCIPIVSNLRCFGEYIVPGKNGLTFDHTEPSAVANLQAAIAQAVAGTADLDAMRRRAIEAGRTYSYESAAACCLRLFDQLLSCRQ